MSDYNPICPDCGEVATRHYSNYPACLRSVAEVGRRATLVELKKFFGHSDAADYMEEFLETGEIK